MQLFPAFLFPSVDVASRIAHGIEYRLEFIALVVVLYLAGVYGMKKFIAWRGKPYDLRTVSRTRQQQALKRCTSDHVVLTSLVLFSVTCLQALSGWNFFLAVASAYLFAWTTHTVTSTYATEVESMWELTCDYKGKLANAAYRAPMHIVRTPQIESRLRSSISYSSRLCCTCVATRLLCGVAGISHEIHGIDRYGLPVHARQTNTVYTRIRESDR
jgi:hypothetical protein